MYLYAFWIKACKLSVVLPILHWHLFRISIDLQWWSLTKEIIPSHLHLFKVTKFISIWFKEQITNLLNYINISITWNFIIIISLPFITSKIDFFISVLRIEFCFTFTFYVIIFIKIHFICLNLPQVFIKKALFQCWGDLLVVESAYCFSRGAVWYWSSAHSWLLL